MPSAESKSNAIDTNPTKGHYISGVLGNARPSFTCSLDQSQPARLGTILFFQLQFDTGQLVTQRGSQCLLSARTRSRVALNSRSMVTSADCAAAYCAAATSAARCTLLACTAAVLM